MLLHTLPDLFIHLGIMIISAHGEQKYEMTETELVNKFVDLWVHDNPTVRVRIRCVLMKSICFAYTNSLNILLLICLMKWWIMQSFMHFRLLGWKTFSIVMVPILKNIIKWQCIKFSYRNNGIRWNCTTLLKNALQYSLFRLNFANL